jgi:hypothetical protein
MFEQGALGIFDEHAKLRPDASDKSAERDCVVIVADRRIPAPGDIAAFSVSRAKGLATASWSSWAKTALAELPPAVTVSPQACVRVHRFKTPRAQLVAFERNIDYHMSEDLKQAGGNEVLEKPISLEATLLKPCHIYDLRAQKYLGHANRIQFTLDPWQPSLLALTEEKLPPESIVSALAE